MGYIIREGKHTYLYEVEYGEELQAARITVNCEAAAAEGLFLVKAGGQVEPATDRPGFGTNPLRADGIWPHPPAEAILDAMKIARAKAASIAANRDGGNPR